MSELRSGSARGGGPTSDEGIARVLVVDDDGADACITVARLKRLRRPVEVEVVHEFDQALFLLNSGRFDIAFVDYHLGLKTGLELISTVRRQGVECALVLQTGNNDPEVELRALDMGATDFLDKSELTVRSLERTLRYSIQRTRELNEIARLKGRLEAVIEGSSDGIWDWSVESGGLYLSTRFCELIGADPDEPTSLRSWIQRVHPEDRPRVESALRAEAVGESDTLEIEYRVVRDDGDVRWMYLRGKAGRGRAGRLQRIAGSQTDITERKQREDEVRHRAFHDALTGLGNRAALENRMDELQRRLSTDGVGFSLVFLDLDGFKAINDRHGHATGDAVLQEVAARLQRDVSARGSVARVGGDEFVVLVPGCTSFNLATELAQTLETNIARPVRALAGNVRVGVSWGVRTVNCAGIPTAEVLADADAAMYSAKDAKRRPVAVG